MTTRQWGLALVFSVLAIGCRNDGSTPAVDAAANSAPSISGSAQPVISAGTQFAFAPESSDPDGDPLMFSIRNQPEWARFDSLTGQLSGTPGQRDVGRTNGVEISVTDGQATAVLPSFSLEVAYAESRSVTLSWMPPVANADGMPLFDLAGFRIYYGNRTGEFPFVIDVANPGLTAFVIENLSPGRYYFATTALDSSGNESPLSEVIEVLL